MSHTLLYNPDLAGALLHLGIPHPGEAAIFLSQLSYWLKKKTVGHITRDGKHWIYNTYQKWISQIKSLTIHQFGKMIRALATYGLIEKTTFAEQKHSLKGEKPVGFSSWNNTTWVTLCLEKIKELTGCELFENEIEDSLPKADGEENNSELLESAPRADVHIRTSGDSQSDDRIFHLETPSIYKENLSLTKDGEDDFEKEKEVPKENSGSDPSHPSDKKGGTKKQLSLTPKISEKDNSVRSSEVRKKRINNEEVFEQEVWEIAIGKPFPVFLNWRADKHYKPQGGRWESDAHGNAYSEFYRNREKTTAVLFPQFMKEVKNITARIHQAQSNDMVSANVLPSWFIESLPEPTIENVRQLMSNLDIVIERGVRVVLPNNAATPSSQTLDYKEVQESDKVKPLPQMEVRALPTREQPPENIEETLKRKQLVWKNTPLMRDSIKRWAEDTPGVVITSCGPALETEAGTVKNTSTSNPNPLPQNSTSTSNPNPLPQNSTSTSNPNPLPQNSTETIIDDPWEVSEPLLSNTNEVSEVDGRDIKTEAQPSLMKLMLAVWDNIYELGQLVLNARSEDLTEAVVSLSLHHRAHIKQAASRAWYPGLNRDGDYKGERVEIWEVGQSPTVKVRTKRGAFLKVRRNDLKPWLGI